MDGIEPIASLYVISNNVNDKLYYGIFWAKGKTAEDRFKEHMHGSGTSKPARLLHEAAKEIGPEHFSIHVLCVGPLSYIRDLEEELARAYSLVPAGYNGNAGGCIVVTDEINAKRSMSIKKWIDENPDKAGKGLKVAHAWLRSDEGRKVLSERISGDKNPMHGKTHSEEAKRKMSAVHLGVPKSEETKARMRKPKSPEHKAKIGAALKGKTRSEEMKAKVSAGLKRYFAQKKADEAETVLPCTLEYPIEQFSDTAANSIETNTA